MKHACVIGWPIEHSRSPIIHGYWLKHYGIDGTYTKRAVSPGEIEAFLNGLAAEGLAGCNVTIPHKEAAFRLAANRDASAIAVGAANTLWLEDGCLCAANTDTYGYMTYLGREAEDWGRRDAPVSILGAGGAARAIVYGFLEAGVPEVRIFNRSVERAEALAQTFGPRVKVLPWDQRSRASTEAAVLVNTTSVGLKGAGSLDMDFTDFHPDCIVSDIVYVPLETAFIREARRHGLRTVDGLGMLLHQAVPGFEKWFGLRPEVTDELYDLIAADIEAV
ncbi:MULTISPECIES: shikimate dehydrogenase [Hyphomicrobium]|jgi:shikimate dehydrogenase|uniref:shikimate dehydrogenase n=1 Tax=Hyphomicrobium TaxID=81 RepID=UPI00036B452D|nr:MULTISPECIES: shikimate dehydrogenase [Hyphomicrobium]WBT38615.1 shikimate dehydrogenase [Hyphomicrobium sp. DMF-1]HML44050.1 shikimate dehydrogenase [Hyphomicrobium zavarzinii]